MLGDTRLFVPTSQNGSAISQGDRIFSKIRGEGHVSASRARGWTELADQCWPQERDRFLYAQDPPKFISAARTLITSASLGTA